MLLRNQPLFLEDASFHQGPGPRQLLPSGPLHTHQADLLHGIVATTVVTLGTSHLGDVR